MNAESFVYWLQGALELGQLKELNEAQVKIVQDHLNLVLKKVTPQYSVPNMPNTPILRQPHLGAIFDPQNTPVITC